MKNALIGMLTLLVLVLAGTLIYQQQTPISIEKNDNQDQSVSTIETAQDEDAEPKTNNSDLLTFVHAEEFEVVLAGESDSYTPKAASLADGFTQALVTGHGRAATKEEFCDLMGAEDCASYSAITLGYEKDDLLDLLDLYLAGRTPMLEQPLHRAFTVIGPGYMSTKILEFSGVTLPGADESFVWLTAEGHDVTPELTIRGYARKGASYLTFRRTINDYDCSEGGRNCDLTAYVITLLDEGCADSVSTYACIGSGLESNNAMKTLIQNEANTLVELYALQ